MFAKPMLAKEYDPEKSPSAAGFFPRTVQPKLDGVRMLATRKPDGRVALFSRTGKPFDHLVPCFKQDISALPVGVVLDGELFLRGAGFQNILSMVKNTSGGAERDRLMYNVYDVASLRAGFVEREAFIADLFKRHKFKRLERVHSVVAKTAADVERHMDAAIRDGFEGIMLRDPSAMYENGKRSSSLLKYKRFKDAEFRIVGHAEASGKDTGTVVFVCSTEDGKHFRVRPMGTHKQRAQMLKDASSMVGRQLTVKFQEMTDKGIPRFPVGIYVRDDM